MNEFIIPPSKKKTPIVNASFILCFEAINVPKVCC